MDIFYELELDSDRMCKDEETKLKLIENFNLLDTKYQNFLRYNGMSYDMEISTLDKETNEKILRFAGNINEFMCFKGFKKNKYIGVIMYMVDNDIIEISKIIPDTDEEMIEIIKVERAKRAVFDGKMGGFFTI